jgi:hypothetical protein
MQKPEDHLTLTAEDGEALIARVPRSNWPRADAERVEWVIRMYFYVVFALQDAKLSAKRLRSLLFGKRPEASSAAGQAESDGLRTSAVREADADGVGATGHHAPPVPRASSAAMRSWRWGRAAQSAGKAPYMSCPPGWRFASTAMPYSALCPTHGQSCAARRVARALRPGCPMA